MERRGDEAAPAFDVRVDTVGDQFFDGGFAFGGEEVIPGEGVIDQEVPHHHHRTDACSEELAEVIQGFFWKKH